jgi:putative copper resistance protein D
VHLVGDIIHLLAASAWLGALAMLACLIVPTRAIGYARITTTHRALAGFATIGSIIVGLIVITGIMNSLFLIGIDQIGHLATDTWGRLMLAKITLFVAMLGMAAANRFRLTPRLEQSIADGNTVEALSTLRRSVLLEIVMAFGILGLVAWLGTLEPIATG